MYLEHKYLLNEYTSELVLEIREPIPWPAILQLNDKQQIIIDKDDQHLIEDLDHALFTT
jgi:hypothetical protein